MDVTIYTRNPLYDTYTIETLTLGIYTRGYLIPGLYLTLPYMRPLLKRLGIKETLGKGIFILDSVLWVSNELGI